jgi:hypothetical protein
MMTKPELIRNVINFIKFFIWIVKIKNKHFLLEKF